MTTQELIDKLNLFDFLRKIKTILTQINTPKVYPIYTNNSTAVAGGLKVGEIYSTTSGDVKVVTA